MRTARLALVAAGLAAAGFAVPSGAATTAAPAKPKSVTWTDAAGDSKLAGGDTDITGVTITTTGKTVAKKYVADTLVVRLTLSAAPSTLPITNFEVDADTDACGSLALYYDGQDVASGGYVSCGGTTDPTSDATYLADGPVVDGTSIVWTIPFSTMPKEFQVGSTLTNLDAYVSAAEPLTGFSPSIVDHSADIDSAATDQSFKIG